jgi:hypothetical protein
MCALGSAIGGTLLPIAARNLINEVGYVQRPSLPINAHPTPIRFKWTMRILGFIMFLTLGCTNLLLERRLPPISVSGGIFNLHAFKSPVYTIYCLSALLTFMGMYSRTYFFSPFFLVFSRFMMGCRHQSAHIHQHQFRIDGNRSKHGVLLISHHKRKFGPCSMFRRVVGRPHRYAELN